MRGFLQNGPRGGLLLDQQLLSPSATERYPGLLNIGDQVRSAIMPSPRDPDYLQRVARPSEVRSAPFSARRYAQQLIDPVTGTRSARKLVGDPEQIGLLDFIPYAGGGAMIDDWRLDPDLINSFGLAMTAAGVPSIASRGIKRGLRAAYDNLPDYLRPDRPSVPSVDDINADVVRSLDPANIPASDRTVRSTDNLPKWGGSPSRAGANIEGKDLLDDAGNWFDYARASDARWRADHPGETPWVDFTQENMSKISDVMAREALEASQRTGNAATWYRSTLQEGNGIAALMFPEILTDPVARSNFGVIQAVTSNGATVQENARFTVDLYDQFRKTGRFPEELSGGGKEARQMEKAFIAANDMAARLGGPDKLMEFLNTDFTVRELNQMLGRYGLAVSGEGADQVMRGSAMFGPKIGAGFYQNIMGNFDPLTSDRWWMRSWGRWTGQMHIPMGAATRESQSAAFLSALKAEKVRKPGGHLMRDLERDPDKLLEVARGISRKFAAGGFKDRSDLNRAAKNLAEGQDRVIEQPHNAAHRAFMRETVDATLAKLRGAGLDIQRADLQALLWYPEKDIARAHGIGNKRAAPTAYDAEFAKIAEDKGFGADEIRDARAGGASGAAVRGVTGAAKGDIQGRLLPRVDVFDPQEYIPTTAAPVGGRPHLSGMTGVSPGIKKDFSGRVGAALHPSGRNIIHEGLGIDSELRPVGVGSRRSMDTGDIENNPLTVSRINIPLDARGGVSAGSAKNIQANKALQGLLTSQDGSPWFALAKDPLGTSRMMVPASPATPATMGQGLLAVEKEAGRGGAGAWPLIDTAGGHVGLLDLGFGPPISEAGKSAIARAVGSRGGTPMTNLTPEGYGYVDRSGDWREALGSGAATRGTFEDLDDLLTPAKIKKIDTPEIRQAAQGIHDANEWAARQEGIGPPRPDVQNMLKIIAETGLAGLRKALGEGQFLPALGAIGLTGALGLSGPPEYPSSSDTRRVGGTDSRDTSSSPRT